MTKPTVIRSDWVSSGTSSQLWAITSYFNPAGFRRRRANYEVFRSSLQVPLATVELSCGGTFELGKGDADILVQIDGGDVMWQKERLLNVAVSHVPSTCRNIAWLDCDVVFPDQSWVGSANQALESYGLVHLFHERLDLPRDVLPDRIQECRSIPSSSSLVYVVETDPVRARGMMALHTQAKRRFTSGLAWVARRELLEELGLYDACVVGSGDKAVLLAGLGEFGSVSQALQMNQSMKKHFLKWAEPFSSEVGRVGYIPGKIYHLWHGELTNRRYGKRHSLLPSFDFDPEEDIVVSKAGCWRWASEKPALHRLVRDYFAGRMEDGVKEAEAAI